MYSTLLTTTIDSLSRQVDNMESYNFQPKIMLKEVRRTQDATFVFYRPCHCHCIGTYPAIVCVSVCISVFLYLSAGMSGDVALLRVRGIQQSHCRRWVLRERTPTAKGNDHSSEARASLRGRICRTADAVRKSPSGARESTGILCHPSS